MTQTRTAFEILHDSYDLVECYEHAPDADSMNAVVGYLYSVLELTSTTDAHGDVEHWVRPVIGRLRFDLARNVEFGSKTIADFKRSLAAAILAVEGETFTVQNRYFCS